MVLSQSEVTSFSMQLMNWICPEICLSVIFNSISYQAVKILKIYLLMGNAFSVNFKVALRNFLL